MAQFPRKPKPTEVARRMANALGVVPPDVTALRKMPAAFDGDHVSQRFVERIVILSRRGSAALLAAAVELQKWRDSLAWKPRYGKFEKAAKALLGIGSATVYRMLATAAKEPELEAARSDPDIAKIIEVEDVPSEKHIEQHRPPVGALTIEAVYEPVRKPPRIVREEPSEPPPTTPTTSHAPEKPEPVAKADPVGAAAAEFAGPLATLRTLRNEIGSLCERPAGTWLREMPEENTGPRQLIRESLKSLKDELERWRPASPCHACSQVQAKLDGTTEHKGWCKRCLGTGWLPAASSRE